MNPANTMQQTAFKLTTLQEIEKKKKKTRT
jgi:hypothetical protein